MLVNRAGRHFKLVIAHQKSRDTNRDRGVVESRGFKAREAA